MVLVKLFLDSTVIDSDAGTVANKGAFTNIALSFNNNITGIRISPFSVYAASEGTLSDIISNSYSKSTIYDSSTLKPNRFSERNSKSWWCKWDRYRFCR
jgi:hypothetical protein